MFSIVDIYSPDTTDIALRAGWTGEMGFKVNCYHGTCNLSPSIPKAGAMNSSFLMLT